MDDPDGLFFLKAERSIPGRMQFYAQMADRAAYQISGSFQNPVNSVPSPIDIWKNCPLTGTGAP